MGRERGTQSYTARPQGELRQERGIDLVWEVEGKKAKQ